MRERERDEDIGNRRGNKRESQFLFERSELFVCVAQEWGWSSQFGLNTKEIQTLRAEYIIDLAQQKGIGGSFFKLKRPIFSIHDLQHFS